MTIAPTLVGGVRAVQGLLPPNGALAFPRLAAPVYARAAATTYSGAGDVGGRGGVAIAPRLAGCVRR